ncbi:hypothetical protein A0H81_06087 [Grifola frondosa]|uniref:Uncharacterized protein n=1 Tax=Grifola frondosa TaxID=5627 RepID=A0A1C7MB70_GRIFR|nr:hypothetical protein A0H81_06087 [Grifola frondosa]
MCIGRIYIYEKLTSIFIRTQTLSHNLRASTNRPSRVAATVSLPFPKDLDTGWPNDLDAFERRSSAGTIRPTHTTRESLSGGTLSAPRMTPNPCLDLRCRKMTTPQQDSRNPSTVNRHPPSISFAHFRSGALPSISRSRPWSVA